MIIELKDFSDNDKIILDKILKNEGGTEAYVSKILHAMLNSFVNRIKFKKAIEQSSEMFSDESIKSEMINKIQEGKWNETMGEVLPPGIRPPFNM